MREIILFFFVCLKVYASYRDYMDFGPQNFRPELSVWAPVYLFNSHKKPYLYEYLIQFIVFSSMQSQ
jgi:hypothetical protein